MTADKIASGQTAAGVAGTYDADGTVSASDMKAGIVAYAKGKKVTGKQTDYGNVSKTLKAGESYSINEGFYGAGKIVAATLASQTAATATAAQIKAGQTAWVNGSRVAGTAKDYGSVTKELAAGESYTIGAGLYSAGKIAAKSLASQQSAIVKLYNIKADRIVQGYQIAGVQGTSPQTFDFGDTYKWPDNTTFTYPNTNAWDFNYLDTEHGNWPLAKIDITGVAFLLIRVKCGSTYDKANIAQTAYCCIPGHNTAQMITLRPNATQNDSTNWSTVRLMFWWNAEDDILYYHPMRGNTYGTFTTSIEVLCATRMAL